MRPGSVGTIKWAGKLGSWGLAGDPGGRRLHPLVFSGGGLRRGVWTVSRRVALALMTAQPGAGGLLWPHVPCPPPPHRNGTWRWGCGGGWG